MNLFERKRLIPVEEINSRIEAGGIIERAEADYAARVSAAADSLLNSGCRVAMLTGPSASGKTTSSLKLAGEIKSRGGEAHVISLDDFYKNIEDYPKLPDGRPDFESVGALDIEWINRALRQLVTENHAELPRFDFLAQRRMTESYELSVGPRAVVIIEGIHALNPLLSQSVKPDMVIKIYAGLREEYSREGARLLATRDLRITRRLVRDYFFRGHSVRNTLELWPRLLASEEQNIKVFKKDARLLLDTSFSYEPGVFGPLLAKLCTDESQGGEFRATLLDLNDRFADFTPIAGQLVPQNSMLREFIGGLEL